VTRADGPVARDDEHAFTALFEQHRHGVHAFLLARTSQPDAARDLLQETFLRLWQRLDEIVGLDEGRRRAWIYTVARNLVIDRYRSEATRRATLVAVAGEAQRGPNSGERDPADDADTRDELDHVSRAIAELPEEERTIITMASVGEMTSQQIGQALSLPAGTVRYRLHRARARLAERLEGSR
jgi:RNA polymerase sigma-70 factor, ECF subfamily